MFSAFTKTQSLTGNENVREKLLKVYLPIVKPDKLNKFLAEMSTYFVMDESIDQTRCPGLLKSKEQGMHGLLKYLL